MFVKQPDYSSVLCSQQTIVTLHIVKDNQAVTENTRYTQIIIKINAHIWYVCRVNILTISDPHQEYNIQYYIPIKHN